MWRKNVHKHRQGGAVAFAHVGEGQTRRPIASASQSPSESTRLTRTPFRRKSIVQQPQHLVEHLGFDSASFEFLVIQVRQATAHTRRGWHPHETSSRSGQFVRGPTSPVERLVRRRKAVGTVRNRPKTIPGAIRPTARASVPDPCRCTSVRFLMQRPNHSSSGDATPTKTAAHSVGLSRNRPWSPRQSRQRSPPRRRWLESILETTAVVPARSLGRLAQELWL